MFLRNRGMYICKYTRRYSLEDHHCNFHYREDLVSQRTSLSVGVTCSCKMREVRTDCDSIRKWETSSFRILIIYFICSLFKGALPVTSNERVLGGWRIGNDGKASGRGLIQGTLPEFAWTDWGKSRRNSATIAVLRAEIWTRYLNRIRSRCVNHSTTTSNFDDESCRTNHVEDKVGLIT
jgi:hypothetical protein